jgi:alkylhydroperoxidase family enzyme
LLEPLEPPFEERQAAIMERIAPGQERPLGLFRLLAHNPDMFEAFLSYGSYNLSRKCSLSIHDRELVIFRAAGRAHGEYEWGMHALLFTEKAGLSEEQVRSCAAGGPSDECWKDPRDQTILTAVDDLHAEDRVSASVMEQLERLLSPAQILDLILIAGWYRTLSNVTESLSLPLEPTAARFPEGL